MERLTRFIEEKIAPPLIKFSNLRYVQIMQRTFISFTSLLIIGSIFLLLASLPFDPWQNLIGDFATKFSAASGVGTAFIAVYVVVAAAYATIEYYNKKRGEGLDFVAPIILAVASFFIIVPAQTVATVVEGSNEAGSFAGVPTDFLGAKGVFVALIVGIVTIEIYRFFINKKLTIKMPEGVPPMVANAFIALIPSTFAIIFWWLVAVVFSIDLPNIIMGIFTPLVSASDTASTAFITSFLNRALWAVGIHGGNVVGSIANPIWTQMTAANQLAMEAGKDLPYMFTSVFYDNYVWTGLAPLATVMIFSKSKRIKALGILALPAALFNIGEPLIFGLPIVMNPLMMIPFVLGYMLVVVAAVVLTSLGIIPIPVLSAPWILPAPIKTLMATSGSVPAVIFVIVTWIILGLVFYPFVKAMEKNDLKEEAAHQALESQNKEQEVG